MMRALTKAMRMAEAIKTGDEIKSICNQEVYVRTYQFEVVCLSF